MFVMATPTTDGPVKVTEKMATTLELAQGICDLLRESSATGRERHLAVRIAFDMLGTDAGASTANQTAAPPP